MQKNPFAGNGAAIAAGAVLYRQTCEACHGEKREGIAVRLWQWEISATAAKTVICSRRCGTAFRAPRCPLSDLPTDNVWRIISYLRSLGGNGGPANEVVTGDVAAGEKIFWGRGGCGRCHEVNGRGGIVAPDLSAAGTNSADHLRQMILNPNAAITARHWFEQSSVSVKTRDGEEIRGVKRSEDNYTLILTDEAGELRRFDKQNLVEQHPEFLMPDNYGQVLSGYEIQSLVAYLKSLKARDLSKTAQADLSGGLSFERLRHAPAEPQNWLTYWGGYQGLHFSPLNQITPSNLGQLQARWARHSLPGWERAQERTRAREYPRATAPEGQSPYAAHS